MKIAAIFHPKAKAWVNHRKDVFHYLKSVFPKEKSPRIWFHCASLGEFEQGRPIIEELKIAYPNYKIVLTFYSPSGMAAKSPFKVVDYVFPLPLDTPKNAIQFLQIVQPSVAFFVKYEFWYFYLKTLKEQDIPFFLIAGVFRKNQLFFNGLAKPYLEVIHGFTHLFLQDDDSLKIAKAHGLTDVSVVGDPRIDRVGAIAKTAVKDPIIERFKGSNLLLVLGSTHQKDEAVFIEFLRKYYLPSLKEISNDTDINIKEKTQKWKFLIVPHEVDDKNILRVQKDLQRLNKRFYSKLSRTVTTLSTDLSGNAQNFSIKTKRYTNLKASDTFLGVDFLLLDTIGQLNNAYQYADAVFIGGGFDKSIHNILEPAAFGVPIFFGPNYKKFKEAKDLIRLGGAFCINNASNFADRFKQFTPEENRKIVGKITSDYISVNPNSTRKIINYLKNKNIL